MSIKVKIIPCESQVVNPILIRMNCLALAYMDEKCAHSRIPWAEALYDWVMDGTPRPPKPIKGDDDRGPIRG